MDIPKLNTKNVGLDFDGITFRTLVRRIVQAKSLKFIKGIKLHRTRNGYHIVNTLDEDINLLQHFVLRALIFDDKSRIAFSLRRLYLEQGEGFDVLFDIKESEGKVTERKDISWLLDMIDPEKEIDEIVKEVSGKVNFEKMSHFVVVFPIWKRELERIVEWLEENKEKDYFIKFAFSERDEFFLVFRNLHSKNHAFARGMDMKGKLGTMRRTFWIKEVEYDLVKELK